jgi:integral membrane protein
MWAAVTGKGIRPAVLRYRVMAFVTGVLVIVLFFAGIPLQFAAGHPAVDQYVGQVHGFLYIGYVIVAFLLALKLRMRLLSWQVIILLLAGTIPVLTFVVERWMTRRYIAPALAADGNGQPAAQAPVTSPGGGYGESSPRKAAGS